MLDYAAKFVPKLTGQFEDSPKLKGMVKAILDALTELENQGDALITERWIDTAIGKQLDGAGYIVGESRKGRDDEAYRKAIKFRVFVNISKGTPDDLVSAVKFLTSPTDCQYLESFPATAILFTNGMDVPSDIHDQLQTMAPVALSDVPVCVSFGEKPFRFGREALPGELFVNDQYLTAEGSDLQVTQSSVLQNGATLGGVVPSELDVGIGYLDLGGPTLAVYNPNTVTLLGDYKLTGVYQ
jgi:hypothetical protein